MFILTLNSQSFKHKGMYLPKTLIFFGSQLFNSVMPCQEVQITINKRRSRFRD